VRGSRTAAAFVLRLVGVCLLTGLAPTFAAAQAVSGTILGTVTDASGAVVPGARVTLTHAATGLTREITTDSTGMFAAPLLATGSYTVAAEAAGFRRTSLAGVLVTVDQKVRAELTLEVGERADFVTVQAGNPLVQASSSDLGATLGAVQIQGLPLNGRNFVSLTRTVPGVSRGILGSNIDGSGGLAWRNSASFSANGQRPRDNTFLLDGVDNNESWLQSVVVFPSVDALEEFKLQTSTYAAEFGKSLGGVVNLQVRSGSNELHGGAFGFLRDDALDANNFFNNRAGIARAPFRQHQFGGTLAGPLWKDRTFFFADYQGTRIEQGVNRVSTVPTQAMRAGDFSGISQVIYDPLTGRPFPGNVVPRERWDPAARNVLEQLIPPPNTEGRRASGQVVDNYVINPQLERQDDQFDVKIDHALSGANRFFLRYSFERSHRVLPPSLPRGDGGVAGDSRIRAQSLAFNDTHTFGPRWLNELRLGYSAFELRGVPVGYGENLAEQMGIPNANLGPYTSGMTAIQFGGGLRLGSGQPMTANLRTLQVLDNVTLVHGRHTLKAGGSATFRSREILNADNITGQFVFSSLLTSNCGGQPAPCRPDAGTGYDVASFLLGYASGRSRSLIGEETYTETRPEWAAYVQDDFRVSSRLTLNLGLRWDVFVPWVEAHDRQSNFDPSTGRFVVASDDAVIDGVAVGRYLQTYSKTDFGPRLGFAYDARGNGRTILRGGVGVFWNSGAGGTSSSKAQNPPFLRSTAQTTSFATTIRLSEGLPPLPAVDPDRPPSGSTRSASSIDARDSSAVNWNLNLQQQLGRDCLVEVAYVGSRGRQLAVKTDQNQAFPTVGVTDPNVGRPYFALSPALATVGTVQTSGTLAYHALLVKLERRFAGGFSFLGAYTYGKAIDLASDNDGGVTLTNVYDPGYNRGPADYDVTHILSSSWIYELPFARGHALGGWQASGIAYWRTGIPVTITQTGPMLSTGVIGNRPDRIGDGRAAEPTVEQWFDPTAFARTPDSTGTFGTAGRNILRAPGQFNVDFSLTKRTRLGRVESELRIEAFNLLNHAQFAQPNTLFGSPGFGGITSMLSNPACSACGTTERQIQLGLKLRF
jgi:carboxypeptidase family protein